MIARASARILVVDDELALQTTLAQILQQLGHHVRIASDGFSALSEMRREVPEILVSDLNMPGMSGFEFLSVVRRRFPAMQVIAMSGAYLSDRVPDGVAADAFYRKGTALGPLLETVHAMTSSELPLPGRNHDASLPVWLTRSDPRLGKVFVTVPCHECLRSFSHSTHAAFQVIQEAACIYCFTRVRFAVVRQSAPSVDRQVHDSSSRQQRLPR